MAARRVHSPAAVAHRPSPRLASTASTVLSTMKAALVAPGEACARTGDRLSTTPRVTSTWRPLNAFTGLHVLVTLGVVLSLSPVRAQASPGATRAAFIVDSTVDAVDANLGDGLCATAAGECTLRAAIQETNALTGDDSITLPAGVYRLTIPGADEDAAAIGDLDISDNLTLAGAGASRTSIDGNGSVTGDRVFHMLSAARVRISGATVSGGKAIGGGPFSFSDGGGIYNSGTLTMNKSSISGNTAKSGGGLDNSGKATINKSALSGNTATGQAAHGGGAYNSGTLAINTSSISENTA